MRQHPERVATLQANTRYLRSRLQDAGFKAIGETNVIPVLLPTDLNPKVFAQQMLDVYQVWVSPIWFIAKPRLRITANALHDRQQMDRLVDAMVNTREYMMAEANSSKSPVPASA